MMFLFRSMTSKKSSTVLPIESEWHKVTKKDLNEEDLTDEKFGRLEIQEIQRNKIREEKNSNSNVDFCVISVRKSYAEVLKKTREETKEEEINKKTKEEEMNMKNNERNEENDTKEEEINMIKNETEEMKNEMNASENSKNMKKNEMKVNKLVINQSKFLNDSYDESPLISPTLTSRTSRTTRTTRSRLSESIILGNDTRGIRAYDAEMKHPQILPLHKLSNHIKNEMIETCLSKRDLFNLQKKIRNEGVSGMRGAKGMKETKGCKSLSKERNRNRMKENNYKWNRIEV